MADKVRHRILELGKSGTVFDHQENADAVRYASAIQECLQNKARSLVESAGSDPILVSHSNNATSYVTQWVAPASSSRGAGTLIRQGRALSEFL